MSQQLIQAAGVKKFLESKAKKLLINNEWVDASDGATIDSVDRLPGKLWQ